jgi:hypothetical protein
MTIYLLDQYLLADTRHEAHEFAHTLGLGRERFHYGPTPRWYYQLDPAHRDQAIALGARRITLGRARELTAARQQALVEFTPTNPPARRYNPQLRQHSWTDPEQHLHRCRWCGLTYVNQPGDRGWFKQWSLPDGTLGDTQADGKLPLCLGPAPKRDCTDTQYTSPSLAALARNCPGSGVGVLATAAGPLGTGSRSHGSSHTRPAD